MNSFIIVALVCSLAISAIAQGRGGPGGGRGGPGGPRGPHGGPGGPRGGPGGPRGGPGGPKGPRGPPPNVYDMFSNCEPMAESMRTKHQELKKSGEIGPQNCQGGDHKVCMQKDTKKLGCAVTEKPSQECMDEIMAFMQGDTCDGESGEDGGEYLDPSENEYSP